MKKSDVVKMFLTFSAVLAVLFAGCKGISLDSGDSGSDCSVEYGSLSIAKDINRSMDVSEINKVKVTVSGTGITVPLTAEGTASGGKTDITVEKIPVGKNRIVALQAYNGANEIEGAVMYAVTDIKSGLNSVTVNWTTSKIGKIYNALLAKGVDISALTDTDKADLEAAIPSDTHSVLIDAESIANDYKTQSLKSAENYILKHGTVSVSAKKVSGYTVQVTDIASKLKKVSAPSEDFDLAACPGTWKVRVLDGTGKVVAEKQIPVTSEKTTKVSVGYVDASNLGGKTIVFVKSASAPHIWAWEEGGVELSKAAGGTWGTSSAATKMVPATAEYMENPSGWYMIDYTAYATGKVIKFILDWSASEITGKAGSFWYDGTTATSATSENPSPAPAGITITVGEPSGSTGGSGSTGSDDKIIVHAKYKYVYLWDNGNSTLEKVTVEMQDEGGGWYTYEIPAKSSKLIFKPNGGDDWEGKTSNLSRTAGVWWYSNGKWTEYNPEDSVPPVLESFVSDKTGTVSGEVKFTVSASDNLNLDRADISINRTKISTVSLSGKTSAGNAVWDSAKYKNGTYEVKCIVYDIAGNASSEKTVTLTTNNENLPPVAVIKGAGASVVGAEKTYSAENSYDQNGGTITSWIWTVTGASIKSGQGTSSIVVEMPNSTGAKVIIGLVVKDDDGAPSTQVTKTVSMVESSQGDFRDETIYFLMTTRFYDGDSSNNEYCWDEGGDYLQFSTGDCGWRGDFKGLAEKLDYIKALGFSAIWITPVVQNASGIDYHGYHAYDFSTVDPRYESTGFTYQDLIDACHAKKIKVIQDIVLNHTGNFGEKNLFRMFNKDSTHYVNPDVPTPDSTPRSPFMSVATDGNAYQKLMAGLAMTGESSYSEAKGAYQYAARINAMKEDSIDTEKIYHHAKMIDWNSELCQLGQMAGDCVDLNTENPVVFNYLKDCYVNYINMGVDAFRIDTVKHISRLTFNKEFIPAFMEAGGENFYIFGETCARYRGRWNEGVPALSPSFYTWKETETFAWSSTDADANSASASAHFTKYKSGYDHPSWAGGIANHLLNGNDYHQPDYSKRSYLDQIDFPMHWAFNSTEDAFNTAVDTNDSDFNDATWNVTYVDSHDYAPDSAPENARFNGSWPDKLNLMFTFRGIPCIYYGSEIEFKKGCPIDPANTRTSLEESGRAYFGTHLEGSVTASDFGEFTASGTVAATLNHPLAQHIIRLNKIRRAIPALRKGQYSVADCSGGISFKRRYTDDTVDSFALVAINADATFSNLPGGTYVDVITGDSKNVPNGGSLSTSGCEQDNMRVYVNTSLKGCEVSGKIGTSGTYLK